MSDYIYAFRFKIEVVFAWLDTYKRILVRFEQLAKNFKSWLFIAASMINFRHIFNLTTSKSSFLSSWVFSFGCNLRNNPFFVNNKLFQLSQLVSFMNIYSENLKSLCAFVPFSLRAFFT